MANLTPLPGTSFAVYQIGVSGAKSATIAAMRFTLRYLFLAVAMLALACAGMIQVSPWWTSAITTLTVLIYAVILVAAVGSSGRCRVTAIAFSLIGAGYLLLISLDPLSSIRDPMLTNHALGYVWNALELGQKMNIGT